MNEFERLRKRRETISQPRVRDEAIPGYGGYLIARYHIVPWEVVSKIAQRAEKAGDTDPRTTLNAQIDLLVSACEGLFVKNGDGDKPTLEPLLDGEGQIIKYDKRLAENMQFEANSAREVVLGLFVQELAIANHHNKILEWMQGEAEDVDEEFLGESSRPLP